MFFLGGHPFKVTHGDISFWGINKWDYVELKNTDIQLLRLQNCPIRKWEQNHLPLGQIVISAQIISTICSNASNFCLFYHNFPRIRKAETPAHIVFCWELTYPFSALLSPWFSKVAYCGSGFLVRKHLWWFAAQWPDPGTSGYGCPVAALTTTEPKPSCEGNVDFWSKRKMVPWTKITRKVHWGTQNGLDGGIFQDSFPVKLDGNGKIAIFK